MTIASTSAAGRIASRLGFGPIAARWRRATILRTFVEPGRALTAVGRFDEADRLLAQGLADYPDDLDLLFAYAAVPQQSRQLDVAIARWQAALRVTPDRVTAYTALSAVFRATFQSDQALELIGKARKRFPGDVTVLAEAARVAEHRGAFEDALQLWQIVCARPDPRVEWLERHAHVLVLSRRFEDAERFLDTALALVRTAAEMTAARDLIAVRGILAAARNDWPAAVAFWSDYMTRFPESPRGWQQLGRARYNEALSRAEQTTPVERGRPAQDPLAPIDVGLVADAAKKDLLLGFESIGESCEFGLVQRRFGAEPLGLFRWNSVPLDVLVAASDQSFAGMGEPDNTEILTQDNGEFIVKDRRWGFPMHTWMFAGQVAKDVLHAQMCRRIVFLKDKFLADLAAAEKVFVYVIPGLDAHEVRRLHIALKAHGPVKLLVVQPRNAGGFIDGFAGDVVQIADDLCLGFLDRLGQNAFGAWEIVFDDWISLCETAAAIWTGDP